MTFIDTNILVHAVTISSPQHRVALAGLQSAAAGWISRQVMREFVGVITRPQQWSEPVPLVQALRDLDTIAGALTVAEDGPHVWMQFERLARDHAFGGKQVHDAYLAATVIAFGGKRLLTFNAKHFRRFAPLIEVVEPDA